MLKWDQLHNVLNEIMSCLYTGKYSSSQKQLISIRLSLALMRTGWFRALTWLKLLSTSWIPVEEFEIFGTKMPFMPSLQLTSQERTRKGTWLAEEHKLYAHIRLAHKTSPKSMGCALTLSNCVQTGLFQHPNLGETKTFGSNCPNDGFWNCSAVKDQNFNKERFKLFLQVFLASTKLTTFTMGLWCQAVNAEQNFIRRICGWTQSASGKSGNH